MKTKSLMIYSFIFLLLNVAPSLQVLFSVIGLDRPLVIPPGEDVVLPCHLSPQINAENMTIRWFKDKYQNLVHLYRKREDQNEYQMEEYRSRTTLIKDGIKAGHVSLIIHNVRPSDSGLYTCFYDTGFFYEEAVVELTVAVLANCHSSKMALVHNLSITSDDILLRLASLSPAGPICYLCIKSFRSYVMKLD